MATLKEQTATALNECTGAENGKAARLETVVKLLARRVDELEKKIKSKSK